MSVKIKGTVLAARRAFVEKHFGQAAWDRVLNGLTPEDRKFHAGLQLAAGWYPFEIGERLDKAIVKTVGNGDLAVFEAIGAQSAHENLTRLHHNFLSPGDPQAFMAKTGLIYQFYYNTGRREYQSTGQCSGVMTTFDGDTFSEVDCHTVIGWYREALKMCGARTVQITHEVCRARGGPFCRYSLSWEL
jgi:hypothetical protein